MFKLTTLIFGTLVSLTSFASTHGGGILMVADRLASGSELIYHMGENDKSVRFAYGQLQNGQWQIQNIELPKADLLNDEQAINALNASRLTKKWVELKK
ncbi:MAG: hypothetical protein ACK4VO_13050 [Pseudobdellovibrio sp.]